MELKENVVRRLKAAAGHKLTQAGEVSEKMRVFADSVRLAPGAEVSDWHEVSDAEAAEFIRQRAEAEERQRLEIEKEREREALEARLAELKEGE